MADDMQALLRLAGYALAHAAWSVEHGETLCTMAMIERNDERELARYEARSIPESVELAHEHLRQELAGGGFAALVMDGYATPEDGDRTDALIVELFGPGAASVGTIIQPYRPARRSRIPFRRPASTFQILGQPTLSDEITVTDAERILLAAAREHEEAGRLFTGG